MKLRTRLRWLEERLAPPSDPTLQLAGPAFRRFVVCYPLGPSG
jgi:hypothetical protein